MNMKVVVIWGIAVLLFAGLGIFGYFNQDVLNSPIDTAKPYVPDSDNESNIMVCAITRENGDSSYRFILDATTNNIASVQISYSINNADIDTYSSASNLNNANINGITANLAGTSTDFALAITANVGHMDNVSLEGVADDLSKLGIIIDNVTDYATYKNALLASGNYTCD